MVETPAADDGEFASIRTVDPTTIPDWDRVIGRFPEANVFHTAAWATVLKETYGHEAAYRVCGPAEQPQSIWPLVTIFSPLTGRRGVCLPAADYCEPLLAPGVPFESLWDSLLGEARAQGWRHLEVRGEVPLAGAAPSIVYHAHTLDLRVGTEGLLARCKTAARSAMRKAERAGVQIRFGTGPEDVDAYYRLHELTRRRHGLPPQPKRFFDLIGKHLLRTGRGFVALANEPGAGADRPPLAALVFLHFGRRALYKFGASDLRQQEYRANNLLMWKGIEHCVDLGMDDLHFGRTNVGQEGLRRFKLAWGTSESPLRYHRFGIREGSWRASRSLTTGWHNAVFRNLPLPVNRWLGALAYRHMD
jgi:hypothetical protein